MWIGAEDACKDVVFKTYQVNGGARLTEPVVYEQEPLVSVVGDKLYAQLKENPQAVGTVPLNALKKGNGRVSADEVKYPISSNKNLQILALNQVKFKKQLPLVTLMAFSDNGKKIALTDKVDAKGQLDWTAPEGNWTLYAVFQGWHGKMVERAAPGGEGNVMDHFSASAVGHYLARFDSAFQGKNIQGLRAFFCDSYEVDDARGEADWTPGFFNEFQKRRGYDLREHLPALFGKTDEDTHRRVLCDYRETVSDLLLENFTQKWHDWAHGHNAIIRDQAHGSPANILDLYAASDIPETEGTEILRFKFASSAGHVTGKKLISSESATWLDEHFKGTLSEVKKTVDRFFLGGVNHIFYHGTAYSPAADPWPGWLFYASVNFNPQNTFWDDFSAFNAYVARCQSFLQQGKPDNDVLLYFPIFDSYMKPGKAMLQHFDGLGKEFDGTGIKACAEWLEQKGYGFDLISDRQIQNTSVNQGQIKTSGLTYKTIILPAVKNIPLSTMKKIMQLAEQGATVIAFQDIPQDVPGLSDLAKRQDAV